MKSFSYWQSPSYISSPPPYILLGLASAKFILGEDFELLTPYSAKDLLGEDLDKKDWKFTDENEFNKKELMSIVAKSDFIRMSVIEKTGGIWVDADTIFLRNYKNFFEKLEVQESRLAWHSEQFFGAFPGNEIVKEAAARMMNSEFQIWGNPGGLKDLINARPEMVINIPYSMVTPRYVPDYTYATRDVMLNNRITADEFLLNSNQNILKLYNTPFANTKYGKMSINEFLEEDILLTRIFLRINPSKKDWIEMAKEISAIISNK